MTYGTVNADAIVDSNGAVFSPSSSLFKNRIINGDMRIDQRNAGASVTPTSGKYLVDRWTAALTQSSKFTVQQTPSATESGFATRVGAGFQNYLACTTAASANVTLGAGDYFFISQKIEGFNTADLAWGTANAKTVTLSFLVYSSLTGTFSASLQNSPQNRSYPFTYSIPAANTWTQISVTIAGDTSGTWTNNNGIGIQVLFPLGVGSTYGSGTAGAWTGTTAYSVSGTVTPITTNSSTFYITGVQLEKGSTATSFDYRPYGTELSLCQRYYYKVFPGAVNIPFAMGYNASGTIGVGLIPFQVPMRIAPSALDQNGTANNYMIAHANTSTVCSSVPTFSSASVNASNIVFTVASGLTTGQGIQLRSDGTNGATAYLGWSAEL